MPKPKKHVLLVLGRIGRYWGNGGEVLLARAQEAQERLVAGGYTYDRVVLAGGHEIEGRRPNALILYDELQPALEQSIDFEQLVLDDEACRNQVALIHAVDDARAWWPNESISFHVVTSSYAMERMKAYFKRHVAVLADLHGDRPFPRQLCSRFFVAGTEPPAPLLNHWRERARQWLDLRLPEPVPPVVVN